jgi:hypothetical protein
MVEREDHEPCYCEGGYAEITDIEKEIRPGGETYIVFRIRSNCDVATEVLTNILNEIMRDEPVSIIDKKPGGQISSPLGFSGDRWDPPYESEGPRKNWRQPPEDPKLN